MRGVSGPVVDFTTSKMKSFFTPIPDRIHAMSYFFAAYVEGNGLCEHVNFLQNYIIPVN
jgi:hypothetical protein